MDIDGQQPPQSSPPETSASDVPMNSSNPAAANNPSVGPVPLGHDPDPTLVTPTKLAGPQIKQYIAIADKHTAQLLSLWDPHVISEAEYQFCLANTRRLIWVIRRLEHQKDLVAPLLNPKVEMSLFMARVEYRVTFGRIFRFQDLPTEIICNIFQYVCWSAVDPVMGHRARARVTSVSKFWRRVALEDPTLWNVVWFKYVGNDEDLHRAATWFERGANAPKDVRISDSSGQHSLTVEHMSKILAIVSKKWATIRVLVVITQKREPVLMVLNSLQAVADSNEPMMMKRLELHRHGSPYVQVGGAQEPEGYRDPMSLFGGAIVPSLTHFSLNGVHVDWVKSHLANLTILDLRRIPLTKAPTLARFRKMLISSPMLQKLILDGAGPSYADNPTPLPPPVTLLRLRVLALVDFSASYGCYILSVINAPYVKDLTLMNLIEEDYTRMFTALTGAFKHVKILTLYNSELFPFTSDMDGVVTVSATVRAATIRWLNSMPFITYFRIGSLRQTFLDIFFSFTEPETKEDGTVVPRHPICPHIQIMEWQSMDGNVIFDFLTKRKAMGVPLKKMYIGETAAVKVERSIHGKLATGLAPGGNVFLLRAGHKAPEEAMLLQD